MKVELGRCYIMSAQFLWLNKSALVFSKQNYLMTHDINQFIESLHFTCWTDLVYMLMDGGR